VLKNQQVLLQYKNYIFDCNLIQEVLEKHINRYSH